MTMNPLPPQAYTKETLLKAYQWLMLQNSSIKEMATTPDILVALYLKTTRDGQTALDRPSIQNFKNELKSLAGIMGELDRTPSTMTVPASGPTHHAQIVNSIPNQTQVSYTEKTLTATTHKSDVMELFDGSTQKMIQEVREDLNLSSDFEALRFLIKIGYTRAKTLLS
ncbi:MAG: hypothetical protein ACXVCY_17885 [Pseudobdellovibrionaceae bacterium]